MTLPLAPPVAHRGGWLFGRYRSPIANPAFPRQLSDRWRLKEWQYISVGTPELFVAFGQVQLGYASNLFLYAVDGVNQQVLELEETLPAGAGLTIAPSSVRGVTEWRWGPNHIRTVYEDGWAIALDVRFPDGTPLVGQLHLEDIEALALLHDLGEGRAAYTHKAAGMPASGTVMLGDHPFDLHGGLGVLDWTRSRAKRETVWKWASFASHQDGHAIGLNLSAEVYDRHGVSEENAYWVDGKVFPLGAVRFELPPERALATEPWHLVGDRVDLTFRPLGARAQRLDLRLLQSIFVQPYGAFHGRLADHVIHDAFGVVEDHRSVW